MKNAKELNLWIEVMSGFPYGHKRDRHILKLSTVHLSLFQGII